MKSIHKIKLNDMKATEIWQKGTRLHSLKKALRPYQYKYPRRKPDKKHAMTYSRKVAIQCVVSLVVCACVLAISAIDISPFNEAQEGIKYIIEHEASVDSGWSLIRRISDSVPVFSGNTNDTPILIKPTDGEIISELHDKDDDQVGEIYSTINKECYASYGGVIFYIDDVSISNPYLRIRHDYGLDTIYMGVIANGKVGDNVSQGDIIGDCVSTSIGFILLEDTNAIDSTLYIESSIE